MRTAEEQAIAVARMLNEVLHLDVMLTGAGEQWEIRYGHPSLNTEFPPMKIDGQGMTIPKGSPQIIVDLLMSACGKTPQAVN